LSESSARRRAEPGFAGLKFAGLDTGTVRGMAGTTMRSVIARNRELLVGEIPIPQPGAGEALVTVRSCGICGSDLHALKHSALAPADGDEGTGGLGTGADFVLGHEFCVEVLELGSDTAKSPVQVGDLVVSLPLLRTPNGDELAGFTPRVPGAYAENTIITTDYSTRVPNGLDARRAAVTEPLAVGLHAVNRSGITRGDSALVLGCGPIGLVVIAWLRARGLGPIVAADYSPARRALATTFGADAVVDPREEPAIEGWRRVAGGKPLVLFECIGVPGILDAAMQAVPMQSRLLIAGVCMEPDQIFPLLGIIKELSINFSYMYTADEFVESLHAIADGRINIDPLLTGLVGFDGVADAFRALEHPDDHVKILIEPNGPMILDPAPLT
jgi:threonine dehydrogenase-like Zn-dependent dehydrogenase